MRRRLSGGKLGATTKSISFEAVPWPRVHFDRQAICGIHEKTFVRLRTARRATIQNPMIGLDWSRRCS
jgi:hypothetical protein